MTGPDDDDAAPPPVDDDPVVRAELERLTPDPAPRWRDGLRDALVTESHRQNAVAARPSHLWLRAGVLMAIGAILLVIALGRV